MFFFRMLLVAMLLGKICSPVPAVAGSASNTRWYSSVNRHAVIVRDGGTFHIVDDATGFTLYEPGACKKAAISIDPAVAKAFKSKAIYACSRGDRKDRNAGKSAWSDSEFHLASVGGRDEWRLFWPGATDDQDRPLGSAARVKAARKVKEIESFDKVLDGIACELRFEKDVNNREYVAANSPFGFCADGKPKDGMLATGEYDCDNGVDPTFLGKRTVKLANRGDAKTPKLFLLVSGRQPASCSIKTE